MVENEHEIEDRLETNEEKGKREGVKGDRGEKPESGTKDEETSGHEEVQTRVFIEDS